MVVDSQFCKFVKQINNTDPGETVAGLRLLHSFLASALLLTWPLRQEIGLEEDTPRGSSRSTKGHFGSGTAVSVG